MKKMINLLLALILVSQITTAQSYDLGEKPEPLDQKKFEFPKYEEATLDNGLRVFFIEDHEQPTLSFNILLPGGDALEQKKDAAGFTAAMLMKGTETKSAFEISKALDGLGANLSVNNSIEYSTISGSSLMKHKETLFNILVEILTKPTFPSEEFEKLKPIFKTSIKSSKSDPSTLASNMAKKALFGPNHPYASVSTEKSIDDVKISDVKDYFQKFYIPNSSTMYIVGDFDTAEMKKELNNKLKVWKKGEIVKLEIPKPNPMPKGIYFIERNGSVQSAVRFANMTVPFSDRDYMPINVSNHIINSSFAGRMFKIIREQHSYTYSPTGGHSSNKFYNYSIFGADVRNDVTDSTIVSIKTEVVGDLMENGPKDGELEIIKQFRIGQYYLGFESPGFLGYMIQQYDFKGVPIRMFKEYPSNYESVSEAQIKRMTQQYLNPNDAFIVVVGDPSVKEKLEKLGTVFTYNTDYMPASEIVEVDIDADDLIENYKKAIGGEDAMESVKVIEGSGDVAMATQGQKLPGKLKLIHTADGKMYRLVDLNVFKSEEFYNGKEGWEISNNVTTKIQDVKLEALKFEADPFHYANLDKYGYELKVEGKKDGMIVAKMMDDDKLIETLFFDSNNYQLSKREEIQETARGKMVVVVNYDNYKNFGGVMLPTVIKTETPMFSLESNLDYKVNQSTIDASSFEPKK